MADTRPDVRIPSNTWIDLYAATSIPVGTAVSVYNKGSFACQLVIKATQPVLASAGVPLYTGASGSYASVPAAQNGLWCYSQGGTSVLVQD